ncbi:ornithine cyclodeaminase family protein [Dactylosporangium sp. NPDC051484]|uniref:ornithine cyclodeaminase family protein n=1 Tax=Dactylosporangium sp. NPDC051484 TaxID=3154942 RepID=UPI003450A7CA
MTTDDPAGLLYLTRADVRQLCAGLDVVAAVARTLVLHAEGRTTLPEEAYLPWHTTDGHFARSLALPGAVWSDRPAIGLKVINSSLANPGRGLPRAQGLTLLFDRERAHPVAIMEAAHISALRTAAYTVLSARTLAVAQPRRIGVVGAGALGEQHVELLAGEYPGAAFVLFDHVAERAEAVAARLTLGGLAVSAVGSAEAAVRDSEIVVTTTTTTTGYIPHEWLSPGALLAHVSLDDVLPDVVRRADLLIVDDWDLIKADDRRLLGRMYRSGDLVGADDPVPAEPSAPRRVDASLGDVLAGRHPGRRKQDEIVLSNPFGMGVLDVAVAGEVYALACDSGVGLRLPV